VPNRPDRTAGRRARNDGSARSESDQSRKSHAVPGDARSGRPPESAGLRDRPSSLSCQQKSVLYENCKIPL
jgi:hypothetical protein